MGGVMRRLLVSAAVVLAAGAAIAVAGAASANVGMSQGSEERVSAMSGLGGEQAPLTTKALRVLKNDDGNQFQCTSDGSPLPNTGTGADQVCTITGSTGTCIEKTDAPVAVQRCIFTQASGDADKHATAVQVAATDKGPSPQKHSQIVQVGQTSTDASNFVDITQVVKQSLGPGHFDDTDEDEPDTATASSMLPITTLQDFHQVVTVDQTTVSGNNDSRISQFGKQRARAMQAPSISEGQNTLAAMGDEVCPAVDDNQANMCSVVNQTSGTGQNNSTLDDAYLQFERAHKTTTDGDQQQGFAFGQGGIDHEIHQTSNGVCKITTHQTERQVMRAVQANESQIQHGPTRKGFGSDQNCAVGSTWTGTQDSTQTATARPTEADIGSLLYAPTVANQDNTMEYFGSSPNGDIRATQSVKQQTNNQRETETNSCPPDSSSSGPNHECAAVIVCGNTESSLAPAPAAAPQDPGRCQVVIPET
jgi:hypothetical protein